MKRTRRKAVPREPLVSAIMITGKHPDRERLARVAVECFHRQTHGHRELVIVNTGAVPLARGEPEVVEVMMEQRALTLGDLRNRGLAAARGEWIIQWDDDDWHAPERMARQLAVAEQDAACVLGSQLRHSFANGFTCICDAQEGIDGTILHHRDAPFRYPSYERSEDTVFVRAFPRRVVLRDEPGLYVRFFHGCNTWSEAHIMERRDRRAIGPFYTRFMVEEVLPAYGGAVAGGGAGMLGVTIGVGERFERMAMLAAREFTRRTGVRAVVLGTAEMEALGLESAHLLKFELFRFFPQAEAITYFDADMIFLEDFNPAELLGDDGFAAVRDLYREPWIVEDAALLGIRPVDYFNSGLFIIARERAEILTEARRLKPELAAPFFDQSALNAAVDRLGIAVNYLTGRYNTHVDRVHTESLARVVGAHLHWLKSEPVEGMERYYAEAVREFFWRG